MKRNPKIGGGNQKKEEGKLECRGRKHRGEDGIEGG